MFADIVFYALVWMLASGITALILSLGVLRKTPEPGADEAAEFEYEAGELEGMEGYWSGDQSLVFDRSEAKVS